MAWKLYAYNHDGNWIFYAYCHDGEVARRTDLLKGKMGYDSNSYRVVEVTFFLSGPIAGPLSAFFRAIGPGRCISCSIRILGLCYCTSISRCGRLRRKPFHCTPNSGLLSECIEDRAYLESHRTMEAGWLSIPVRLDEDSIIGTVFLVNCC